MKGDECIDSEIVVKAILEEHYDPQANRFSPRLFRGPESSLSRLVIWSKKKIIEAFIEQLHNPPDNFLMGIGIAEVGTLKKICIEYQKKRTVITVIEDPLDGSQEDHIINPAHAIIPQKLSDGLAKTIPTKINIEWGSIEKLLANAEEKKGCRGFLFSRLTIL